MRTEPWRSLVAAALALLGAAGCASPSAAADRSAIVELSRAPASPPAEGAVEPITAKDARALAAQPLTAESAVRIALANNREIRAALREVGVARGQLVQAGLLPNPEIDVELTPSQGSVEHTRVGVGVEIDLTSALLAPLRERPAAAQLQAARYRAAAAVVELGYEARAAFYAVQASQERLVVANRALDAFAASRDAARALFESGNVPELDAATQEASYEAARVTVAQIELELLERRERLHRVLGFFGRDTAWRIAADVADPPDRVPAVAGAETRALSASLELAELRSRMDAVAGHASLARTEGATPDVSIGARAEREDEAWQVGAGVRFTLPIFDRRQGTAMAHEAQFDALLERYHGLAVDVRSALRDAHNRLASAHARALHFRRALVPARRRVLQQSLLQYNAMQIGVFQLLQAHRDELDTKLAEVEALREYWTAKAAFDALLGGRRVKMDVGGATASLSAGAASDEGH